MKVLMLNIPFSGHINPTLGLVKELVERGHQVDYILTKEWQSRIEESGARFIPYDTYPDHPTHIQVRKLSWKAAYDTALRVGENYDLIIYELLFFLGENLAKRLNKPYVRLFSLFALNESIIHKMIRSNMTLFRIFQSKSIRKLVTRILTKDIPIDSEDLLAEIVHSDPPLNFIYTVREFQLQQELFSKDQYQFIGPSITERQSDIKIPVETYQKPVIYISRGTIFNKNDRFYKMCIEAFREEEVTLILSVGKDTKIDELDEGLNHIHLYPYVPQLEVLKNADLFVTHGGMNSVNESLYFGVPMLALPISTDQPLVADRIEELGLGKRLNSKKLTARQLREAVYEILADEKIKKNALQMKETMQQAWGNRYAVMRIEEFMAEKEDSSS